jgi:hypothetical protein
MEQNIGGSPSSVMGKIQHSIAQGCPWGSCMICKKKCVAIKILKLKKHINLYFF